jgi:hypothetical protein
MPVQLEDNKRTAIAGKLAEMKAFQNLIIANEEILIQACSDRELSNRLEDFIRDDRKNLGIIDTVIVQYGVKAEPSPKVQKEIEMVGEMMQASELTLFEKVAKQELLKHSQAMSGILVHKAAQVVGAGNLVGALDMSGWVWLKRSDQRCETSKRAIEFYHHSLFPMESVSFARKVCKPLDNYHGAA